MNKSTPSIMVLDDEPFMTTLLSYMLANQGYSSVTPCNSGSAALDLMVKAHGWPDLILLDLNMPEMDGIEFLRHLVERQFGGSLILVSGENDRTRLSAVKLAQAHQISLLGHLSKPASPAKLAEMLEKWVLCPTPSRRNSKVYTPEEVREGIFTGELVNFYQPKVSPATGQVVGMEALVRWQHPQDGIVLPDQFIGTAEEHGLIDDLTRIVLFEALSQTRFWRETGLMLRVAVNISMDNLAMVDFADFVAKQAQAANVPADSIVLEITESQLLKDLRAPLEILTRLRLKRFRLSIDDFGTGHSSLAQLRDIPFDELKIDRSFVHRAWTAEPVLAIFETSIDLARRLGMEVVAEGVEDRDDWDFLRNTGCDLAQGYFIARPMPAEEVSDWIVGWESDVGDLLSSTRVN